MVFSMTTTFSNKVHRRNLGMDSLSQIVLGAAVGEAALGKRLGNRAMVWGAVAGTLPDMDVLGQYFLNELDNLAFHRGISHSILASVLGAVVLVGNYEN